MQQHPNQHYFTAQRPLPGQNATLALSPSRELSSSENPHTLSEQLDALRLAVDAARSALTAVLLCEGQSSSSVAAWANLYMEAASRYRKAQAELYDQRQAALSSARLRQALQEAQAKGILSAPVSAYLDLFAPPPASIPPADLKG